MGFFTKSNMEEKPEPDYSGSVRKFLQSKDVEEKFNAAQPYLITSLVAWPLFWFYKGLEWPSRRGREALPMYIRKTFFQAKLMQLFIISSGIIAATYRESETIQQVFDYRHE